LGIEEEANEVVQVAEKATIEASKVVDGKA